MTVTALGVPGVRTGPGTFPTPCRGTGPLLDTFGRTATDLGVSLTDRCNLRCTTACPPRAWTGCPARTH